MRVDLAVKGCTAEACFNLRQCRLGLEIISLGLSRFFVEHSLGHGIVGDGLRLFLCNFFGKKNGLVKRTLKLNQEVP